MNAEQVRTNAPPQPERTPPAPPANMGAPAYTETPPARQVELAIDDLVLHGFSRHERGRIEASLRGELERLVGERIAAGGFSSDMEIPRIDGGAFTVRRGMRPEAIGTEIARAIMRGARRA